MSNGEKLESYNLDEYLKNVAGADKDAMGIPMVSPLVHINANGYPHIVYSKDKRGVFLFFAKSASNILRQEFFEQLMEAMEGDYDGEGVLTSDLDRWEIPSDMWSRMSVVKAQNTHYKIVIEEKYKFVSLG